MAESPDYGLLVGLGLSAKQTAAGLFGGILRALMLRQASPVAVVTSVLAGVIVANYIGGLIGYYLRVVAPPNFDSDALGGFLAGLSAFVICQFLTEVPVRLLRQRLEMGNGKDPAKPAG